MSNIYASQYICDYENIAKILIQNNNSAIKLKIPIIKNIIGFDVQLSLCIKKKINPINSTNNYYGIILIKSDNIKNPSGSRIKLFNYRREIKNLHLNGIEQFMIEFKQTISNLRFDKITNKFTNEFTNKLANEFNLNSNSIYEYPECVICYDNTTNTTQCDHCVCLECWIKIKNNKCPVCRKKLN